MPNLRVIEDFEEFKGFKDIWNKVLQRSLDNDVFSTWEWLYCWWKHFGKGRKLRVLTAEENGEIVGIAPFMLSKYSFLRFSKLSRIEFIGFPQADYNNLILVKRDLNCLKFFLKSLREFSDWDLLDLRDIRDDSFSGQALQVLAHARGKDPKLKVTNGTLCPHILLPDSPGSFVKSLSQNMRDQLKKKLRRLCRGFKVEFKTHYDFSSVDEAMEAFFKLHQERWGSKGESGAFADENFRNFHLEVARLFNERGWLNLHFLMVKGVPAAADYGFDYNGKVYSYLTGFDPKFGEYSVMNLLRAHLVEESIKKGLREFDLTRDFEPYKADWANGVRKNIVVRHVRKGLSARFYCWALEKSVLRWLSKKLGASLTQKR
ncbi:MAG: GNAT family N-acetyltransferase [Candidatus Bathyarchaeia archaeon]